MIEIIKKILGLNPQEEKREDPPGRTFKKIVTGEYFSCEKENVDTEFILKMKKDKVEQIKSLELLPKFVRFEYAKKSADDLPKEIELAHVVFQKEVFAEKWNMVHVTEMTFSIRAENIGEFEEMAGVSLNNDFKDLTEVDYRGEERRAEKRTP